MVANLSCQPVRWLWNSYSIRIQKWDDHRFLILDFKDIGILEEFSGHLIFWLEYQNPVWIYLKYLRARIVRKPFRACSMRNLKKIGPNFSHLIFEAFNFWGFWGPAEMIGNDFEENKVVTLIFKPFWSRSHLSKRDQLTQRVLNSLVLSGWHHKTSIILPMYIIHCRYCFHYLAWIKRFYLVYIQIKLVRFHVKSKHKYLGGIE